MSAIENAIMFDIASLPERQRLALQREAARREVPFEEVIRESLLEKASRIGAFKPGGRGRRRRHTAAA
jgi:hypothetical protein